MLLISLTLFACGTEPAAPTEELTSDWTTYGGDFAEAERVAAKDLLADPASYNGKTLRVEGRIADVCQKKGCWMVLTEEEKTIRVLAKDHSFGIAKDATSSTADVLGIVVGEVIDPETVAHYESEAANPNVIPERHAVGIAYHIEATSIRVRN